MSKQVLSFETLRKAGLRYLERYAASTNAFKLVLKNYPEIINANHACGPGNTFNYISKYVDKSNINIFLSYEDALNTLKRSGDKK